MLGIGIDFGTTNSIVSIFDGRSVSYLDIDLYSENRSVMPTANYMSNTFTCAIGSKAIISYLNQNQGRLIHLEEENLGYIKVTHGESDTYTRNEAFSGDTTVAVQVHAMVDKKMPGHLLWGLKRWLGRCSLEKINIFGVNYTIVALVTPILNHIQKKISKHIHPQIDSIHIGRPVHFDSDEEGGDGLAIKRLTEACMYADLPKPVFYPEPLGAIWSYFNACDIQHNEIIMAFDFGGGTLDLCLIKKVDNGLEILATHGVPIGGDKINQLIYKAKLFPELGKNAIIRTPSLKKDTFLRFPFNKFENGLLQWQQTYNLNREEYLDIIHTALFYNKDNPDVVEKVSRLKELINWNYSYSVIKAIEKSKIELSHQEKTSIIVDELNLLVEITKEEFNQIIAPLLLQIDAAIDRVLQQAGLEADRVNKVIRTGGSSLIPAVIELLDCRFPDKTVEHEVFKSIAGGLSIANFYNYEFKLQDRGNNETVVAMRNNERDWNDHTTDE